MRQPRPIMDRIMEKVEKDRSALGCWLWRGAVVAKGGYPVINTGKHGKVALVCRVMYTQAFGPIPTAPGGRTMDVCHRCDTPRCVRPDHLFVGTRADNMRDARIKGRPLGRAAAKIRAASVLLLMVLLVSCSWLPFPNPEPSPSPTPEPTPTPLPVLRVQGTHLVSGENGPLFDMFMAIPCCMTWDQGETMWPMAGEKWMDWTHSFGANAFHFRLGPFYVEDESEWKPYGNPYDEAWNPNPTFWSKVKSLVAYAEKIGTYVEVVPLDTWGCKWSQWGNRYMQAPSESIAACGIRPDPFLERHIRQVVDVTGPFTNTFYVTDNEGNNIRGATPDFYVWVHDVIRSEESAKGLPVHIIGTNTNFPEVRGNVDYVVTHNRTTNMSAISGKWTENNERNPNFSPEQEVQNFAQARSLGLHYAMWRAGLTDAELVQTLEGFKSVVEGGIVPPIDCPVIAPEDFKLVARVVTTKPNGVKIVEINPKKRYPDGSWGPILPDDDPLKKPCELRMMGGICPRWEWRCPTTNDPQCPGSFDTDVSGEPWPQNAQCAWPPDKLHPQAYRTTPEGRGGVLACDNAGHCSNTLQNMDQSMP